MTLYLVGLGLGDEKDITVKALEIVKKCDLVYLEHYTSILGVSTEQLERFYGKIIGRAERELVECHAEQELLIPSKTKDVALLVVGDPFGATTHIDLVLRARKMGVKVSILHNASIMTAVGEVGLELYKYGKTTSIPFPDDGFQPETAYDIIKENKLRGLHTLCLLDIKVAEPSRDELLRGVKGRAQTPRFMTVNEGLRILLTIESKRREQVITQNSLAVGIARLGQPDQVIKAGTVRELLAYDFGDPLHSLVIPGTLHVIEEEALVSLK